MTGRSVQWPVYRPHPAHRGVEQFVHLVVGRVAPGSLTVQDFDSLQPPRVRLGHDAAAQGGGKVRDGRRLRPRTGREPPASPRRTILSALTSNQEPMNEETKTTNAVNSSATNGSAGCFRVERDESGTASITFDPEAWRKARSAAMAESTKRGMAKKIAEGGTVGPAPLGYVNRREGKRAWVEIDLVSGPLVREAFHMAMQGYSLRSIVTQMNKRGLKGRRGGPLSLSTLQQILKNRFYAGDTTTCHGRTKGTHEALISRHAFATTQKGLRRRKK